jgi:hypothetical protein
MNNNKIKGLNFRTLEISIKDFKNKGYSYIHLNAIESDFQVLDCKEISVNQHVAHLLDCHNKENYLVMSKSNSYHIIKRWNNDLQG